MSLLPRRAPGPVDGPAIFENCTNCQVAVACTVFKANNCSNSEFGERGRRRQMDPERPCCCCLPRLPALPASPPACLPSLFDAALCQQASLLKPLVFTMHTPRPVLLNPAGNLWVLWHPHRLLVWRLPAADTGTCRDGTGGGGGSKVKGALEQGLPMRQPVGRKLFTLGGTSSRLCLLQHFAAANLDPNNNQWNKVGSDEGGQARPAHIMHSLDAPHRPVAERPRPPTLHCPGPPCRRCRTSSHHSCVLNALDCLEEAILRTLLSALLALLPAHPTLLNPYHPAPNPNRCTMPVPARRGAPPTLSWCWSRVSMGWAAVGGCEFCAGREQRGLWCTTRLGFKPGRLRSCLPGWLQPPTGRCRWPALARPRTRCPAPRAQSTR